MNLTELERSLRQLRLGGMAAALETRLRQAQAEPMAPIDLVACLGDVAAVTAMLDRLLHHGHILKCGPRSWRTKAAITNVAVAALPTNATQEAS